MNELLVGNAPCSWGTLEHQDQCPPCSAHIDGLIGSVEDEYGRVQRVPVAVAMDSRPCEQVGGVPSRESRIGFKPC